MRKSWTDRILWAVVTIVLVMVSALWITGSIRTQAADTAASQEVYYEQMEREYISRVRNFLTEQGYRNSGVTLNRIVNTDRERSYTVQVHHSAIDKLTEEEVAELLGQIENMGFYVPGCSFTAEQLR